jgi:hypothetical protein
MTTTILNVKHEINSQRYSAAMRSAVRFIKGGDEAGVRAGRISAVEDIFATNCPTRSAEFLAEIKKNI